MSSESTRDVVEVRRLLNDLDGGAGSAAERLAPILYGELHRIAERHLRHEPRSPTLQTTEIVHEAFLRLVDQRDARPRDREHFLAIAASMMHRVLVDHARRRAAALRGGGWKRITLDATALESAQSEVDLLALDEALGKLAVLDPRQARIVEMRYFAGLSIEETAQALGVSPGTVKGDWFVARAFLRRALSSDTVQ